jgi:C4-dicarboxylate-specific signal transduction histidine kinase
MVTDTTAYRPTIGAAARGDAAVLTVDDDGPGVPPLAGSSR